jgi:hypothetical protein
VLEDVSGGWFEQLEDEEGFFLLVERGSSLHSLEMCPLRPHFQHREGSLRDFEVTCREANITSSHGSR